ncbi:MAG TPA: SDR family NAD(P)-dependent oxidoreductase, partial [Thermomicrobiales bacterium]|nr:SDR family NAD(P)-dependent oxidoreductase [Thermomicrobiales bacterium]
MGRLEGKRAIITGAGRGIGRAIAEKFLAEGARLVVCDLVAARLTATAADLRAHGDVHELAGDVTDGAFCQALVDFANDRLGGIDILVNNAGIAIVEPFLEHSLAAWNRTLAVNLTAVFQLGQLVARSMVANDHGGAIVNMASSNGHLGERGLAAYNASKAGVILLTKTMAIELANRGIRVNCVSPGWIATDLTQESGLDPAFIAAYLDKVPMGRAGRPEEVANLFAFLASDE